MSTGVIDCHTTELVIRHFNIPMPIVTVGKAGYFPLKTLCERIGIGAQWQTDKVNRLQQTDPKWAGALRMLPVWTNGGEQPMQCLNRRHLGRWLDSLNPEKCSITARGPLKQLERELEAAADRWLLGDATGLVTDEMECQRCGCHHVKIDGEWEIAEE